MCAKTSQGKIGGLDVSMPTDGISVAATGRANNASSEEISVTGAVVHKAGPPSLCMLAIVPVVLSLSVVE